MTERRTVLRRDEHGNFCDAEYRRTGGMGGVWICGDGVVKWFYLPVVCEKFWLCLSTAPHPKSYRVTKTEHYCFAYTDAGVAHVSWLFARAIKRFLEKHGRCYVSVEVDA